MNKIGFLQGLSSAGRRSAEVFSGQQSDAGAIACPGAAEIEVAECCWPVCWFRCAVSFAAAVALRGNSPGLLMWLMIP